MKVAEIGDVVEFKKENISAVGKVVVINENSVIVEVDERAIDKLDLPNNLTVVNHKKYSIVK